MDDGVLLIWGAVLALNVIAWMANWLKINQLSAQLIDISKEIMNTEIEIPGIDDIKDDILGTIQEMRPPNFLDHIGGAISNMLMFKMQREANEIGMLGKVDSPPPNPQAAWQDAEK